MNFVAECVYKVPTPIGGALQVWRSKAVVDIENKLVFLGKFSQPLGVDHVQCRVQRRFHEDHFRVGLDLRFPNVGFGKIDVRMRDVESREDGVEYLVC